MDEFETREILEKDFMGEKISFVASNDRVRNRVQNISNESHVLEEIVQRSRHDDVFWDVGACLGIHSFIVAKFVPHGQVVSFEPMPSNRGILADNKSVNGLSNVKVSRKALFNQNTSKRFSIRESVKAGFGRHSFYTGEYDSVNTIEVSAVRGSDLEHINPNIVKIDVEGAGPLVVEGMKDLLSKDECHTVVFETHEPNPVQPSHEDFGYNEQDFIKIVEDCGFEVRNLKKDYHYVGYKSTEKTDSIDKDGVELVMGDISDQDTTGIINSAGTSLRMGTGVAGSLRDKGGEKLNQSAIIEGPVDVGQCVRTNGFGLDCEYVYHAASMPHYGDGRSTPESVRKSVKKSLEMADSDGIESISVPMVGCGLGGLPITTGARVIRDTIKSIEFDSIEEIRVIGYKQEQYKIVKRVFN